MTRKKETFLLVSLSEEKTKKLAQVISSETSRKILDYLAEKQDATETQIAKDLGLAISTVHYNMQALQEGGLVDVEEFHYSEKGREVNHYKLANKYIIIAPKSTFGIRDKLRSVLPVALISLVGAGAIQLITNFNRYFGIFGAQKMAAEIAAPVARETAADVLNYAAAAANETLETAETTATKVVFEDIAPRVAETMANNAGLWFFVGSFAAIALYLLVSYVRYRKKK